MFQAILDNPQGLWVGRVDPENNLAEIKTATGKIEVIIPELADTVRNLDAASEAETLRLPEDFPFILNAGRRMDQNANILILNPQWNKGKRACVISVHPEDADRLGLKDGDRARVTTAAGSEMGEVQVSERVHKGTILISHGFGLIYDGTPYGLNVNRLTRYTHRDPLGTPIHRFVPCRIEPYWL